LADNHETGSLGFGRGRPPLRSAIVAMLVEDTTAPRKQRHTARRILARLIGEHSAEEPSYSTVHDYVRVRPEPGRLEAAELAKAAN
jgi:hypothetical protein